MNIIATFLGGQDQVTVNGLHQWDWGRKLEIHDTSLPAVVEVHFACPGMREAVIRTCSVVNGVATAVIPDVCIEQTGPIVAWVMAISETSGETVRTITLPVIGRTRPAPSVAQEPAGIDDKYTQLVTAINTQIAASTASIQATATSAEAEIQATTDDAEAAIQAYLTQLTTGEVVPAKAVLAQEIPYVGGLAGTTGAAAKYYALEDCLRFSIPGDEGNDEDLGEVPLRTAYNTLDHVIAAGGSYTTSLSANNWTVVAFSIDGIEYESLKFRITSDAVFGSQVFLDAGQKLGVVRAGADNKYIELRNRTQSTAIKIMYIYQYKC